MLDYMARTTVLAYPWSLGVASVVVVWSAVSGEWVWALVAILMAAMGWFHFTFARWWLRTGEDNDIREWMRDHPDYDPSE